MADVMLQTPTELRILKEGAVGENLFFTCGNLYFDGRVVQLTGRREDLDRLGALVASGLRKSAPAEDDR
jgi:hypothetical protein